MLWAEPIAAVPRRASVGTYQRGVTLYFMLICFLAPIME